MSILNSLLTLWAQTPDLPAPEEVAQTWQQKLSSLSSLSFEQFMEQAISAILHGLVKVAIALAVFFIGKWIINRIHSFVAKAFVRRNVELSLRTFLLSLIRIILMLILIVIVIGILGINTSSFLAIFASAGLAVGMALSGTLQNFAGGVMILLFKPYKVGDFIEAQGYSGTVKEIQIFNTILNTPDNKTIIIPNGGLSTGSLNNYSKEGRRRVDWKIGIAYGDGPHGHPATARGRQTGTDRTGPVRGSEQPGRQRRRGDRSRLGCRQRLLGCLLRFQRAGIQTVREVQPALPLPASRCAHDRPVTGTTQTHYPREATILQVASRFFSRK